MLKTKTSLHYSEGQMLTVLDQNLEDAGWWKGDINGKIGVFPDNFVEILSNEKVIFSGILVIFIDYFQVIECILC